MSQPAILTIGSPAPELNLPATGGTTVRLADYKGSQKVVLYFYPKDNTPGCTTEAQNFRDAADAFAKANTIIIGISKDSVECHEGFARKQGLHFLLASDEEGDACERYGAWGEKNMYGKKYMGITRATFLIDTEGNIAHIWPKVRVDGHVDEVLELARKL